MSRTPTIESSCADVIDERGPTLLTDLAAEMVRQGRTRARNPEAAVASVVGTNRSWRQLPDERWTTVRQVFRDVRFAHRLTVDEIAIGLIDPNPDFSPLAGLPGFPLAWRDEPALVLPATFGELASGDVVLAIFDRGRLALSRGSTDDTPTATPVQQAGFADAAQAAIAEHQPSMYNPGVSLDELLLSLVMREPGLLSGATLVLTDLIAAAGLETKHGQVASPGTDWGERERFLEGLRRSDEAEFDDDLDAFEHEGYWPRDEMPDSAFPRETDRTRGAPQPLPEMPTSLDARRLRRRGRRPARRCLQLRIRLLDVRPPIWRRILVPATITLDRLHAVVQEAMGWGDGHLHEFRLGHDRWGDVDIEDEDGRLLDEFEVRLRSIVVSGDQLRYVYDFGDNWRHEIVVEGQVDGIAGELYPLCVDGARACPPEDCGGIHGYQELLQALASPRSRRQRDLLHWLDGPFHPDAFSIEEVNARLDLLG